MFWLCPPALLPPLLLASASPRRADLLRRAGLSFSVAAPDIDEAILPGEDPPSHVERLAREKGEALRESWPGHVILSADTVVVLDGRILGKPRDVAEAEGMLADLSGRWHVVYTGWALAGKGLACRVGHERTRVLFHTLDAKQIAAYVATGEPMDKAGAYGIQDGGSLLVKALEGDYFTVMGLPVAMVCRELAELAREISVSD